MTGLAVFAAKKDIKQRALADAGGVTVAHISYVLSGERTPSKELIDLLLAYCRTFDPTVTYDDLFGPTQQDLPLPYAKPAKPIPKPEGATP